MTNGWRCHEIVLEARAPIHIGWHELGYIQRTRYYIPSRAVWGALVAAYAPRLFSHFGVPGMYGAAQARLKEALRFTCFFPTLPAEGGVALRPCYRADGLSFGGVDPAEFERRFVSSQASAALAPPNLSAEDGALHESECLVNMVGPGPLCFVGYVFTRDEELENLLDACTENMWFGADRCYGWGSLVRKSPKLLVQRFFDSFVVEASPESTVSVIADKSPAYLPSHLEAGGPGGVVGDLEVLCGREWSSRGSGQRTAPALLCWAPGSRLDDAGSRFRIDPKGVWHAGP